MSVFKGLRNTIPTLLKLPRTTTWLIVAGALLLLIAIVSPVQLPVVLYKAALVALGVVLGYWVDRALFPYSRPDGYLNRDWRFGSDEPQGEVDYPIVPGYDWVFAAATVRRALIVAGVIAGLTLGL